MQASTRRQFLSATAALAFVATVRADMPQTGRVRATSGDAIEPKWQDLLILTVGPQKADIIGTNDRAIQAAVDYCARLGGGTVQLLPGTFRLRNAIHLSSRIRLRGSDADTILIKEPSQTVKLAEDSDWFDQEVTLTDGKGFQIGDGVCLRAKNPHNGSVNVAKRTLVARSGNRFKLDRALRENFWKMGEATVSSLFPMVTGENVQNLVIENLALDGNRKNNENLDGNHAGCIFFQDCSKIAIRGVTARDYNGDGMSWQVCHDVHVEDCHSHGHAGLGLHPGSGSQRPVIRGNRLEHNDIGLFFCWGVKFGLAEKNIIRDCRSYGISIGHRDTDNVIRDNEVKNSGKVGIYFRAERGKDFAAHRNRVVNNRITDSGADNGIGIDVQGQTESVTLERNDLHESRGAATRIGIRLAAGTKDIALTENKFTGFKNTVVDLRSKE